MRHSRVKKKKSRLEVGLYIGLGVGVLSFIGLGFDSRTYIVEACTSTVSKYVTAEYSETSSGIDMNGEFYSETDYWSEPASEVNTIVRVNTMPSYPDMPPHDTSLSRDSDFDSFKYHTDTKLNVYVEFMGEHTYFNEPINKARTCIESLGSAVGVKEWWGISYSSDFGKESHD